MPDNASCLDTLGHVLQWCGRLEEAELHLRRAYELAAPISTTRGSAAAGLALLCSRDRPEEAAAWLARAQHADPENRLIARAIAAVEPLRPRQGASDRG